MLDFGGLGVEQLAGKLVTSLVSSKAIKQV
jgi:hypothetical protein